MLKVQWKGKLQVCTWAIVDGKCKLDNSQTTCVCTIGERRSRNIKWIWFMRIFSMLMHLFDMHMRCCSLILALNFHSTNFTFSMCVHGYFQQPTDHHHHHNRPFRSMNYFSKKKSQQSLLMMSPWNNKKYSAMIFFILNNEHQSCVIMNACAMMRRGNKW